ncbi:MAG: hypothetical protein HY647_03120 [Acidobacteria bacterium]|nr:hypothetical protein [Acidobacteriota bacterium]
MPYLQAKFCLDRNQIRWTLLEGVITRKAPEDGPTEGKELHIQQVTAVEEIQVKRVYRSRLGWPATLFGLGLLALFGWLATLTWIAATPGLLLGLLCFFWGARRIPARTETLDGFQIVAPGTNPEEWRVVGAIPEVYGLIEGVRMELTVKQGEPATSLPQSADH